MILVLAAGLFMASDVLAIDERPNVLFITLDTTRSDHLGCYGYKNIKTPNIDSLAQEGALFKNVYSQAPLTFPSHTSFFTSTYPQFNKARDNGSYKLDPSAVTLAEIMQSNGYSTAAFVSSFVLNKKFGLDKGFAVYDDKIEKFTGKRVIKYMDERRSADKVTDSALKWLQDNKEKKFFLWAHYYDPHSVYNPPSPYKEIYKANLYDGEIAFADEQIGRLLSWLKEFNIKDNTLIVFCSDHGESFGEHGETGHAVFVYDTTLKVPLILSYPKLIPKGKVIKGQVRLIDIMPTLLDLLNIEKNKEIQGASLARFIKEDIAPPELPAYSESLYAKLNFNWEALIAWQEKGWKYIKSQEPELYNIESDPEELNNLAGQKKDLVARMDRELEDFLKKTSSKAKETKVKLDKETKEKLMSLGYIQGGKEKDATAPVPKEMIQIMQKLNLADRMANEGMIDKAITGYMEILKADPSNLGAALHIAQCYKEKGNYDEAIKYFRKSASFKPEEPEVHDGLGNIYKAMGKVDMAFEEFELALKLDPENSSIINNFGWCYQQRMQFAKAIELYQQALKLDNELPTAHANMAICYRMQGQFDQAEKEINIALKQDPELAFAYSELGVLTAIKGDLDKAISYCKKAIELGPEDLDGYNNLGVCYERKGELTKALESYFKAQKIAPWNTQVYINIGNVYVQQKEFEKAKQYYKKAIEIDPKNKMAIEALMSLEQTNS